MIDTFEIPEELAKELSELMTKQSIRERMLLMLVDQPTRYEEMERMLIPIVNRIDFIKNKITSEYVPEKYRSDKYVWNYNGYDIAKNIVDIQYA